MPMQITAYIPYAITLFIPTLFLMLFIPPVLGYIRAIRRTAARTRPHYLNLCGHTARQNIRRT